METSDLLPLTPSSIKVQAELVKMLYRQTQAVLLGVIATATGVAVIFVNKIPDTTILIWLIAIYGLSFIRYLSVRQFKSLNRQAIDTIKWGWVFSFFAFLSGCSWGAASIIFFTPDNLPLFNILTLIIIAMSIASLAALSAFIWSYYVYVIPAMSPMVWQYMDVGDQAYTIFGVLLLIMVFSLMAFARVNQRALNESIILRFENTGLIRELVEQRVEAEKARKIAEEANIAKTKFLAAASHDLRQPLHAMGLFLGALEDRVEKQDQKLIVKKIQKSSSALNGLLDSLLDISKLDAGIVQAEFRPFCIKNLFESLRHEFEPFAREKNLRLKFVNSQVFVNSDYWILERITRNLLSNAIRYTDKGGIIVGCRRYQGGILLAVYDSGTGIQDDKIEEIFREFHQLDNPERDRSKGLGLGLAIVKRMAQLLNAPLLTKSVPGKGSMFGLVIPRAPVTGEIEAVSKLSTSSIFFGGKLILIVDDEMEIRDSLTELLQSWHCKVITAASGEEAVSILINSNNSKPDIILADYRLRDSETGNDVIHKIQSLFKEEIIPAIIITGDTAPDRIQEADASGYKILHKPVSPDELRLLLAGIISSD